MITSILASGVMDMAYVFNDQGNLYTRTDNRINQTEQFSYDLLNRLTNWDVHQSSTNNLLKANSITYDPTSGNITNKSDLGNFTMNYAEKKADGTNNGPHALTSIGAVPANFPTADLNVTYTDFKKIASLTEGTKSYNITYGVDQQRRKSAQTVNGITTTHYYVGDYEEEIVGNNVRKIHYLSGAIFIQETNQPDKFYYTYADNQGSLIALTDESGNAVEKYAYDPWGVRRNPDIWEEKDQRTNWITNRGYTGHEHIDAFGIINMNGRVYDPLTAQFFSPDPFVQAPDNWVNYNRYTYCFNNPLIFNDPSGCMSTAAQLQAARDNAWSGFDQIFYGIGGGSGGGSGGGGAPYTLEGNTYFDRDGNIVLWSDVKDYLYSTASSKTSFIGDNASDVFRAVNSGYQIKLTNYFGRPGAVFSIGDPGEYSNTNSIDFTNSTAYYLEGQRLAGEIGGNNFTAGNWTNGAGVGLGAISASVGRAIENELAYVNTTSLIVPTQTMLKVGPVNLLVTNTLSKTLTRTGFVLSGVSALITTMDGIENGWQNHHTADLIINGAMTGISIACPVAGLVLGGLYFVGDIASQYYTGRSITQNLFDK